MAEIGDTATHAARANRIAGFALFISLVSLGGTVYSLHEQHLANKLTIASFRPGLDETLTSLTLKGDSVELTITVNNIGTRIAVLHSLTATIGTSSPINYECPGVNGDILPPGSNRAYSWEIARFTKIGDGDAMVDVAQTIKSVDAINLEGVFSADDYPEENFSFAVQFPKASQSFK